MTHDKLLDKIESIEYWQEHFANKTFLKALRAVVELHKPNKNNLCEICRWYMNKHKYPCPTIQAIEKELK